MIKPYFVWKCTLKDDSVIKQYNEDGSENLYSLVDEQKGNIKKFKLEAEDGEFIIVNFISNTIELSKMKDEEIYMMNPEEENELIFMRRNKVRFNMPAGAVIDNRMAFRIGYKNKIESGIFEYFIGSANEKAYCNFEYKYKDNPTSIRDLNLF